MRSLREDLFRCAAYYFLVACGCAGITLGAFIEPQTWTGLS